MRPAPLGYLLVGMLFAVGAGQIRGCFQDRRADREIADVQRLKTDWATLINSTQCVPIMPRDTLRQRRVP